MSTEERTTALAPSSTVERSQWELERRIFHLKTLYEVSQVVGSLRDPQPIAKNLLMMVMGTFGTPRGVILLVDVPTNTLETTVQRGIDKNVAELLSQRQGLEYFRSLQGLGRVEVIPLEEKGEKGTVGDAQLLAVLSACRIHLWIPFAVNDRFRGGIGLGGKLSGESYSADDQELLSTIVHQLTVALDNALAYREIEQLNRGLEEKVRQRTEELRRQHEKLREAHSQLEMRNRFIQSAFGRYLSDEVVTSLLEHPEDLKLGGEKRKTTMLMSDLRGFTPLAEKLTPEQILTIVNRYLGTMVDVILQYQGTINEFIGDAILVLFGAPVAREDDGRRAVACAVAMQQVMIAVNRQNRHEGLPEVEMGIGVHTGEVVIGNIGSHRRMRYGVVGSHVNLTSRVESYTIGGQILISEATLQEAGPTLQVGRSFEVEAKGIDKPLRLYEVRGISGEYGLFLPSGEEELLLVQPEILVRYSLLEGKHLSSTVFEGRVVRLSIKRGEICCENTVPLMSNIRMQLVRRNGEELVGNLYGKVLEHLSGSDKGFCVRFTSALSENALLNILRR